MTSKIVDMMIKTKANIKQVHIGYWYGEKNQIYILYMYFFHGNQKHV